MAAAYRKDPHFVIIARTDNYEGLPQLIERAKAYEAAGADMIMPIGIESKKDLKQLAESISIPLWYGQIGGGHSPVMTLGEATDYSIGVLAFTLEGFTSAYQAHNDYLIRLSEVQDNPDHAMKFGSSFDLIKEFESACGVEEDRKLQKKFFF